MNKIELTQDEKKIVNLLEVIETLQSIKLDERMDRIYYKGKKDGINYCIATIKNMIKPIKVDTENWIGIIGK